MISLFRANKTDKRSTVTHSRSYGETVSMKPMHCKSNNINASRMRWTGAYEFFNKFIGPSTRRTTVKNYCSHYAEKRSTEFGRMHLKILIQLNLFIMATLI
ncbi:hypothetical protein QTP88_008881 [Uroleucon formosanum]